MSDVVFLACLIPPVCHNVYRVCHVWGGLVRGQMLDITPTFFTSNVLSGRWTTLPIRWARQNCEILIMVFGIKRSNGKTRGSWCSCTLLMMGGEAPETCWATYKRQVINLWNCCILLVDLFESYDDARICECQIYLFCWRVFTCTYCKFNLFSLSFVMTIFSSVHDRWNLKLVNKVWFFLLAIPLKMLWGQPILLSRG